MKNISEYISEGIFDDNVKSNVKINGVEIYAPDWKLCEEYFEKRRKKYFGNKSSVFLGDMQDEYTVLYNEKDCIVCLGNEEEDVYVLCPETIYMCHEVDECVNGRDFTFSLTNIDEANDFDICFSWLKYLKNWTWIQGSYSSAREEKVKDKGFDSLIGYIPETISSKAKSIIKKFIK